MIAHQWRTLAIAVSLVSSLTIALPSRADDATDVRSVIGAQMQAFRQGDATAAYSYAAPGIQTIFPTPQRFMDMVMGAYAPVYQATDVTYGPLTSEGGAWRQEVFVTDREGRSWIASYTLERQADGTLKITSCAIRRGIDVGA